MTIRIDPAKNEIRALLDMADFSGKEVLEIGCGDGRLTERYAAGAGHITAIDAFAGGVERAKKNFPEELRSKVEFHHIGFEDFAATSASSSCDIVILSWSLC